MIVVRTSRSITLPPFAPRSLRAEMRPRKRHGNALFPRETCSKSRASLVPRMPCPHACAMDIAAPTPDPTAQSVRRDRARAGYALLGAAGLVGGIWLAWFGAWLLGWDVDDLGVRP